MSSTSKDTDLLLRVANMVEQQGIAIDRIEAKLHELIARPAGDGKVDKNQQAMDSLTPQDRALFDALRSWRTKLAQETGKSAFTIAKNAQLLEVATKRPSSELELAAAIGINAAQRYASEMLGIVKRHSADAAPGEPW